MAVATFQNNDRSRTKIQTTVITRRLPLHLCSRSLWGLGSFFHLKDGTNFITINRIHSIKSMITFAVTFFFDIVANPVGMLLSSKGFPICTCILTAKIYLCNIYLYIHLYSHRRNCVSYPMARLPYCRTCMDSFNIIGRRQTPCPIGTIQRIQLL
jgi:hypothetical protein